MHSVTNVAVVIPCFNEGLSIGSVVTEFRRTLPGATIYVYDNNSTDDTELQALAAGAIVRREPRQGKGHVVRRMFADIEAEVYIMVDGDDTYDVASAADLVNFLIDNQLDLVNGRRRSHRASAFRPGHRIGNRLLSAGVRTLFGDQIEDMLSGFKVMSRRFVKSFPCLTTGFEIETELTIHALRLSMPVGEMTVDYRERLAGSSSKLRTLQDGWRISRLIFNLLRAERPVLFFGALSSILAGPAIALGSIIYVEWRRTGLVHRIPTAILCTGMMVLAFLSLACGLILETVTLGRREQKRMTYLALGFGARKHDAQHA